MGKGTSDAYETLGAGRRIVMSAGCAFFMEQPGTPLARAAHQGNLDQIRELMAAGANPNEYDASSQTALHWAARGGHDSGRIIVMERPKDAPR